MCEYWLTADDIKDEFEQFLGEQEGNISAKELAKAWNLLAKENDWDDRLCAVEKATDCYGRVLKKKRGKR
jgi:hypothetical protein